MSEPPRFGTSDELYELFKHERPRRVRLTKLIPIMTAEFAATHEPSVTRKPILVDKCTMRIGDGNHRYFEALLRGDETIEAYVASPYVQDYKDYSDGKWKIRHVDRPCSPSAKEASEMKGSGEIALVASVAPRMMRDLGITYPIRIAFDERQDDFDQSKTQYAGATRSWDRSMGEISLPSHKTLRKYAPELKTAAMRQSKTVSQLAEELCFVPDTIILTSERAKMITDVEVTDRLYKKGTIITSGANQKSYLWAGFSHFTIKSVREYSGPLIEIKPSHFLPIRCTPNHPFLVRRELYRGRQVWVEAKDLKVGDWLYFPTTNLFKTDRSLPPLPMLAKDKLQLQWSEDLARFFGYYLAEGYTSKSSGNKRDRKIELALGSYETEFIEDILRIVRSVFHRKAWIRPSETERGVKVIFSCKELALYLKQTFGPTAPTKSIPIPFLSLPERLLRALLAGYQRGDGYSKGRISFVTSSKALAVTLQLALLRLGLRSSTTRSSRKGVGIKGRTDSKIHRWFMVSYEPFQKKARWGRELRLRRRGAGELDSILTRIDRVTTTPNYTGPVYNFEMTGLPNYAVFPAIAHNCHLRYHETCHHRPVGRCTIRLIRKYVPARDLKSPVMREKIATLEETMENPEMDSCPDRLELEKRSRRKRRR